RNSTRVYSDSIDRTNRELTRGHCRSQARAIGGKMRVAGIIEFMSQSPAAGLGQPLSIWSPQQLERIQYEWRRLQRSFAFHPFVEMEAIQIVPAWRANDTLVDAVQRVGRLVAFQSYDPNDLWNPTAMDWVAGNAQYVPTDSAADLAVEAGGDPLDRICKSGE